MSTLLLQDAPAEHEESQLEQIGLVLFSPNLAVDNSTESGIGDRKSFC